MRRATRLAAILLAAAILPAAAEPAAPAAPAPVTTTVAQVTREEQVKVVGMLAPLRDVMVDSEVGGLVTAVRVHTGDAVKEGDVLVSMSSLMLDKILTGLKNRYDSMVLGFAEFKPCFAPAAKENTNELFLAIAQARINRDFQAKELNRTEQLLKEGTATAAAFDAAKMAYDQAANGLAQAEQALVRQRAEIAGLAREIALVERDIAKLDLRAPFAGRVVDVYAELGEQTSGDGGSNVVRLVDDSRVRFRAGVPEEYHRLVAPGARVTLAMPGVEGIVKATVTRVAPVVDAAGRAFAVEVEIPNAGGLYKPGLFCTGHITVTRTGLAVPAAYVTREEGGDSVRLSDGTRVSVRLVASPQAGEVFISGEGIAAGTELVK
ncbi:MAG: efflux RND transporter periplasmic adaptor subunit [Planctomycetota bacterium]